MIEPLSPYIIAALAGWFFAHCAKFVIQSIQAGRPVSWRVFFNSGNLPSSHSATVVALLVVIALRDGTDTGLFGLATLFAGIVMFDAIRVRRSSGEQGVALTQLIKKLEATKQLKKGEVPLPRVAKGHTPVEVAAGALLGAIIGAIVFFATS